MSLKEKILKNSKQVKCINCSNYELLNNVVSYCNKSDKLILAMQIDVIRKCDNFELKEANT